MSDEKEFASHGLENSYKTSLKARSYSSDKNTSDAAQSATQSSTGQVVAETTVSSGTGAGVGAAIASTSVVAVAVASVVIVIQPVFKALPQIQDMATAVAGTSISCSFTVSYVKAGSLEVRLENIGDKRLESYELAEDPALAVSEDTSYTVPTSAQNALISSDNASVSSDSVVTSVSGDSSSYSDASSASVSSTTYQEPIKEVFKGLFDHRNYVLSVVCTVDSYTQTVYSETLTTGDINAEPSFAVTNTAIDYDKSELSLDISAEDPSNHLVSGSFFAVLEGTCLKSATPSTEVPPLGTDGDVIINDTDSTSLFGTLTRTVHLYEPYTAKSQTLSLSGFTKGYVIRLRIYGINDYVGPDSDSALTPSQQIFYEAGLYY
jgi:hypothetical protein